jgi:hypothetical protein
MKVDTTDVDVMDALAAVEVVMALEDAVAVVHATVPHMADLVITALVHTVARLLRTSSVVLADIMDLEATTARLVTADPVDEDPGVVGLVDLAEDLAASEAPDSTLLPLQLNSSRPLPPNTHPTRTTTTTRRPPQPKTTKISLQKLTSSTPRPHTLCTSRSLARRRRTWA